MFKSNSPRLFGAFPLPTIFAASTLSEEGPRSRLNHVDSKGKKEVYRASDCATTHLDGYRYLLGQKRPTDAILSLIQQLPPTAVACVSHLAYARQCKTL